MKGMASSHGNIQSESAKMEQIITEFFTKSLHIILESRSAYLSSRNFSGEQVLSSPSSSTSSSSSVRPRDKWFNLALRDCPAALENIDFWRQSTFEPMVVDVVLVQRPRDWDPVNISPRPGLARNLSLKERFPNCWNSDREDVSWDSKSEKIIERWIIQYENRKSGCSGSKRSSSSSLHTLYKKSILLMRSLYLTVRLFPAYKLFHKLNSSNQLRSFNLAHHVSSFVEPFTRREEAEMQRFGFAPVETACGRLSVSVLYHSSVLDVSSEPKTPMSPQFIPDYVGSPLTDTLKRFPSLPVTKATTQGSLSSSLFSRRHSWSYDNYRASIPCTSFSPSPSPTHIGSRAMVSHVNPCRPPPMSLPAQPPDPTTAETRNIHFDEYWPSPTFSPSTSSSPPVHAPGTPLSKALGRSGSAPVTIPAIKLPHAPSLLKRHVALPSPPPKGSQLRTSRSEKSSAVIDQLSSLRDDIEKASSGKASNTLTWTFSRSSSRLSLQEDFDDAEFACPFDMDDDDDMTNPDNRPESLDQKATLSDPLLSGTLIPGQKSQDAAVGTLVRILKKAPPLRQDMSKSLNASGTLTVPSVSSTISPSTIPTKTTSDALEELQSYREMKDLLLNKSCKFINN
uniref:Autophagy-related protein 13 N-terminal domain-containing protein n=1 Tax=Kalanchoe fedtschenkoi TaxID=63787 RepID=A0A7N0T8R7_KALFE